MHRFFSPFHVSDDPYELSLAPLTFASAKTDPIVVFGDEGDTDYADDVTTTGTITVNGEAETGTVEAGFDADGSFFQDFDWFRIEVVSGTIYTINTDISYFILNGLEFTLYNETGVAALDIFVEMDPITLEESISFSTTFSGVAFLAITAVNETMGPLTYDFSVTGTAPEPDDFAGDTSTTGAFIIGDDFGGNFESDTDTDWFAFDIEAGGVVRFDTDATVDLRIYDADGNQVFTIISDTDFVSYTTLTFTAETAGTYYLEALPTSSTPFSYNITSAVTVADVTDDITTTAELAVNETYLGVFDSQDDIDWIRVQLDADQLYVVQAEGNGIDIEVFDADGNRIDFLMTPLSVETTGTYYLSARGFLDNGNGDYSIRLIEVPEDAAADATTTALISLTQPGENFVENTGDVDWFRLDLSELAGDIPVLSSDVNLERTELVDVNGNIAGQVIGTNNGNFIVVTDPNVTGDVFLVVEAPVSSFYTISIVDRIADDFSQTTATSGAFDGNGVASGQYDYPTDSDWFTFTVDEAGAFAFNLDVDGIDSVGALEFFDDNGDPLSNAMDGSTTDEINGTFTSYFATAGTYYVAFSLLGNAQETPTYTISAESIPDDAGNSYETGVSITEGEAITLTSDYRGDRDVVRLDLVAGQVYELDITDQDGFSPLLSNFTVFDASGNEVNDLSAFNAIYRSFDGFVFIAETSGTYAVQTPGNFSSFNFQLNEIIDDFGETGADAGAFNRFNIADVSLDYFGDRDAVRFTLDESESVLFRFTTQVGAQILDLDGNVLSTRDFANEILAGVNLGAGDYLLVVDSQVGPGSGVSGDVVVEAITSIDDFGDTAATAGDIAAGNYVFGAINRIPGTLPDIDYHRITLDAGETIQVVADGLIQINDLSVGVFDAAGTLIATNVDDDGSVGFGPLEVTAESAGTYVIVLGSLSGDVGNYSLAVANTIDGTDAGEALRGTGGFDYLRGGDGNDAIYGDVSEAADLSQESIEGQVFRAYQAVLGRAPDLGGFNALVTNIRFGVSTQADLVAEFVGSAEFAITYGDLTTSEFVETLFDNVLPGNEDPAGRAAFINRIDNDPTYDRVDMVLEFTNTPEFIARMLIPSAAFAQSVVGIHPDEATVFRIYQAVFDRAPDEGGFTANVNALQGNALTVDQITASFVGSAEFAQTYGDLSNAEFVEALFANVLPGNTDQAGRAAFLNRLDNDANFDRADMVTEFVQSPEFISRQADAAAEFVAGVYTNDDDVLWGQGGNDLLFGGRGADTFIYTLQDGSNDTIVDFTPGVDTIQIAADFSDPDIGGAFTPLQFAIQIGSDVIIRIGDYGLLRLENTRLSDLDEFRDFEFANISNLNGQAAATPSNEDDLSAASAEDIAYWDADLYA